LWRCHRLRGARDGDAAAQSVIGESRLLAGLAGMGDGDEPVLGIPAEIALYGRM
jgi:hypothetical protein